ncbi:DUF3558 family protein [Streptomyces griseoaurantiacus]|uniref:Secreted protein n=1 Tax=Streptomyces griseoaurantiacus M045 TaxID=996637 RepID=F3NDX2_9ACTN|nr:secreted protein [Streptomyces griseoaurantiacus M045]
MHRPAQRDRREQSPADGAGHQGHGPGAGRRPGRLLWGAAVVVPAMLIAAGCSSGSSEDGGDTDAKKPAASATASDSASSSPPAVREAAYAKLPDACAVLAKKTLEDLVPKDVKGKAGSSDDTDTRANCSWDSLDNNGVKGSQFRWLNVAMLRFDSDASRGEGDKRAQEYYTKQVADAQAVEGAKKAKTEPVPGTGDEATLVRYDLKKKEGVFKQQTVVTRVENVVLTLDYNGAGLAGDKTPDADGLVKLAKKAAKEAVASVASANKGGGSDGGSSPDASKSSSDSKDSKDSKDAKGSKDSTQAKDSGDSGDSGDEKDAGGKSAPSAGASLKSAADS